MNKILVVNNKLSNLYNDNLTIIDNHLIFNENGDYNINYIDCDNINLTIEVKPNVFVKLFEYSNNENIKVNNHYIINKDSNLLLFKLFNNKNTTERLIFDLNDENAKLNYHFSSIAINNDNYYVTINHNSSKTISNVINRSIAKDKAIIDFTIDSYLPKGKINCYLNQDTKIITLGDNNSTIRPNMFIEEVDVEARHASAIGKFSDSELFYLMSRGITYNDSLKLLIKGFIFANLIMNIETREKILNIINTNWR